MLNKFVGEHFSVSLISNTEKVRIRAGGGIKIFRREVFVSQCQKKNRRVILYCCIISGMEKVRMREGEYQDFPSKTFCLTVPTIFHSGDLFSVSLVPSIEKFYASEAYLTIFEFLSKFFLPHSAEQFRS